MICCPQLSKAGREEIVSLQQRYLTPHPFHLLTLETFKHQNAQSRQIMNFGQ